MPLLSVHRDRMSGCVVLLGAVTALGGCGGSGDGVATIDGHALSVSAFRHWLGIVAAESGETASDVPEPPHYAACVRRLRVSPKGGTKASTAALEASCASRYRTLRDATLGFLIPAEWLLAEAQHLGIAIPDAQVKKEFVTAVRRRYPRAAEFESFLARGRYTVSDLLLRVKLNLVSAAIERKVVTAHSKVTGAEVEKYYAENRSRFGTPEKRAVYIILTKTEVAARNAKNEIESGKSFSSVAKRVSIDPASKARGGLLSEVIKGQSGDAFDAAVFSARRNALSGPIKTPSGYYVFSVKSIRPGSQPTPSTIKSQIRAQLALSNESRALSSFGKGFKTHWIKKTECAGGYVVMQCSAYARSRKG